MTQEKENTMKDVKTGITRQVDSQGRVHIPKFARKILGWSDRDYLEVYIEKDKLVLKKYKQRCVICNSPNNLVEYRGKTFCKKCFTELQGKDTMGEEVTDND